MSAWKTLVSFPSRNAVLDLSSHAWRALQKNQQQMKWRYVTWQTTAERNELPRCRGRNKIRQRVQGELLKKALSMRLVCVGWAHKAAVRAFLIVSHRTCSRLDAFVPIRSLHRWSATPLLSSFVQQMLLSYFRL